MPKLPGVLGYEPAYSTYDINAGILNARDRKLPVRPSFFSGIVPQVSAQDAAQNRADLEAQRGGVGIIGKILGNLGLDESGERKAQTWGNALRATAMSPVEAAQGIYDAVLEPYQAATGKYGTSGVYEDEFGRYVDDQGRTADPTAAMLPGGLNFAGNMAIGGSVVPPMQNAAGMFGGRLAKTADHAKLATAEKMAAEGAPREAIWRDTGWFKGVDGKWRFEIDDSAANWRYGDETPGPLSTKFSHKDLMKAYPDMVDARLSRDGRGAGGAYVAPFAGKPEIFSVGRVDDTRSTLLHELQHGVQSREGFVPGANPDFGHARADVENAARDAYNANRKNIGRPPTPDDELLAELGFKAPDVSKPWEELTQREQLEWNDAGRGRLYRNNAGEVEARTVQKRADLTPEQRSARPPWLDYDVPESQQIVRFNANATESAAPGVIVSEAARQPGVIDFPLRDRRMAPSSTRPDAFRYEHPVMEALQSGADKYGVTDAAQPLMDHLRDQYGYVVMQKGLPSDPATRGNAMLNLSRAVRTMEDDPRFAERDFYRNRGRPVHFGSEDFIHGVDPTASPADVHIPSKATPDEIASYLLDNSLYANSRSSSAPGVLAAEAADLPMDTASRLARAREMGFDIEAYKGGYPYEPDSGPVYRSSKKGMEVVPGTENNQLIPLNTLDNPNKPYAGFFSDSKDVANRFADHRFFDNPVVWPVRLKMQNPLEIDMSGKHAAGFQFESIAKRDGTEAQLKAFQDAFQDGSPYDGVIARNTKDEGTVYIPRKGNQVRSVNAAFDPAKADSANLLAANKDAAVPGVIAAEAADKPRGDDALIEILRRYGARQ